MDRKLTAIQTSGGRGARARPLSLLSPTSMLPKGLMRIMGIPLAEIQLLQFREFGISSVHVITQYFENREHISNRFQDGSHLGLHITYSDPHLDLTNNGSGDAILTSIEQQGLAGDSIWLANDNLYEFDANKAVQSHRDIGAVVTILTTKMNPRATIRNYGLVDVDEKHMATRMVEKPEGESQIIEALKITDPTQLDNMRVHVNTAGYIINNDDLRGLLNERWVTGGRKNRENGFDMAGSLVDGLIKKGFPVYVVPIDAWGDFGSLSFILDTFPDALGGKFQSLYKILKNRDYEHNSESKVWVHRESLARKNNRGKTLESRIASGDVRLGPNVFIGRGVIIEDGTNLRYSNVEKYSFIGKGSELDHVYMFPYCRTGPYAYLRECALGFNVFVDSSQQARTHINGRTVLGPNLKVPKGAFLEGAVIFPGFDFEGIQSISNSVVYPTGIQLGNEHVRYINR